MALKPSEDQSSGMQGNRRAGLAAVVVLLVVLAGGYWFWSQNTPMAPPGEAVTSTHPPADSQNTLANGRHGEAQAPPTPGSSRDGRRAASPPSGDRIVKPIETSEVPPPLPLPKVSRESGQEERKSAYGLKESVDHIVSEEESFPVHGSQWSIADIREKLAEKDRESEEQGVYPVLPNVVEKDIPSMLRKRIPGAAGANEAFPGFYGVKVVRPGENLWNIHYNILREYFARRGVNLPRHADEPQPDGRSSSVGRILKFLEGAVQVYSIPENRLVRDLDRIHPDDLIVFFNISDVFSVLDNLQPEELRWIRYIAGRLQLERPEGSRELITRKDLFPRNEPPIPESRIPVEEHR